MKALTTVVAVLVVACSGGTDQPQDTSSSSYASYGNGAAPAPTGPDPCTYGLTKYVDGQPVWVPVACRTGWVDPSDPAERAKWSVDPSPEHEQVHVDQQTIK